MTTPGAAHRHVVFRDLRVAALETLTDDSVAVTFEVPPEHRDEYRFVQGQHVSLRAHVGDEVRRNYSICTPASSGVLRVAIKRLPGGIFSTYVHTELSPGDVMEVSTPTGRFHVPLDPARVRTYGAIAAGSGITPIISIIATTLETEHRSTFTLLYGNRTTDSIMFLEELQDLKNQYPARMAIYHVLSRESQEVDLLRGRLNREKLSVFLDSLIPTETIDDWFLCGPAGMTTAAKSVLQQRGVDPGRVHSELFHVDGSAVPVLRPVQERVGAGASRVTVVLDGRRSTFTLERTGETILDATARLRRDVPYACKAGACGTCRAKVVSGEVRMDQCYALEQPDVDAGYVLTCQSHPLTETVTLDFDA